MEKLNPLFSLVRDYLTRYLPLERKSGENTIRSYRKSLELLFDFVKEQKKLSLDKVTFEMIDRSMLSSFLDYLETERGCSPATRNHRLHSIRAFYTYAAENDITAIAHYDEILKVDSAKVAEKLVNHMSEEAVKTILAQPDLSKRKGLRDKHQFHHTHGLACTGFPTLEAAENRRLTSLFQNTAFRPQCFC